jgi:hypothetical protein
VLGKPRLSPKAVTALAALEESLAGVDREMALEVGGLRKRRVALRPSAAKGSRTGVNTLVHDEVGRGTGAFRDSTRSAAGCPPDLQMAKALR